MNYVLAPSILSADFTELGKQIGKTEENGAQYLHFDVMDGMFVPSISFGMPVLKSIKKATRQVIDAHMMVQEPIRYVKDFRDAGADYVTVHLEACEDVHATLDKIRECEMGVGLSICPETPVEAISEYLDEVDMILVMSVHPGFGGQAFLPESLGRIRAVRRMAAERKRAFDVQVDGGIYISNVREVLDAGANIVVSGSGVFGGDAGDNTRKFMEILRSYE